MTAPLACLAAAVLGLGSPVDPPNVVVVVLDDVGVDMLGCYAEGPDPAPTPNLDALAQSGVLFRNAWATPSCSPARAVLLTGRQGFRTGVGRIIGKQGWALQLDELTLPEVLLMNPSLGYRTGAFGKWHLTNDAEGGGVHGPNLQGFERFSGTYGNLNPGESFFDYEKLGDGQLQPVTGYATTHVVDDALAWIQGSSDPWFCYLAFQAPHAPFHEPPAGLHSQGAAMAGLDPRDFPRPFYKAMLEAVDQELGRFLAGLGAELPNTHIVVVADNGTPRECSMAPFLPEHAKQSPYEGALNVPLIVAGPAVTQPGREVDDLVGMADVFATVLDLTGVDLPDSLPAGYVNDSISFAPLVSTVGAVGARTHAYSGWFSPNHPSGSGGNFTMRMIRDERYKLIERELPFPMLELYDLERDPFETKNLLGGLITRVDHLEVMIDLRLRIKALLAGG